MSPPVVDVLRNLEVVTRLVLRARADRDASSLELDAVQRSARAIIERMRAIEAREQASAREDSRRWSDEVRPLLRRCELALDGSDADAALSALDDLARAHGEGLSWASMAEFDAFVTSGKPLDLMPRQPSSARAGSFGALGERVAAPIPPVVVDRVMIETIFADELYEPDLRGLHLAAVRPAPAGRAYTHHGVFVGDGTVVHFSGEPQSIADAAIERADFERFVSSSPRVGIRVPSTFKGEPVASLRPNLIVLRGLSRIGDRGYALMSSNCEHFATWAQLGADYSEQVSHVLAAMARAEQLRPEERAATEAADRAVGSDLVFDVRDFVEPPPEELDRAPLVLDVARAYWAEDLREPVIWLPLWDDRGAPPAGLDRPWSTSKGEDWSRNPPTTRISRDRHAALVWLDDEGFRWLTSTGEWFEPSFDVLEVCEKRLEAASRVLITYLETTHFPTKALKTFDQLGGRRLVERALTREDAAPPPPRP